VGVVGTRQALPLDVHELGIDVRDLSLLPDFQVLKKNRVLAS
jgi:hypothetical protein